MLLLPLPAPPLPCQPDGAWFAPQVVVIPAGVPRKPGMTRDDLFNTNGEYMYLYIYYAHVDEIEEEERESGVAFFCSVLVVSPLSTCMGEKRFLPAMAMPSSLLPPP